MGEAAAEEEEGESMTQRPKYRHSKHKRDVRGLARPELRYPQLLGMITGLGFRV
jgi:hypothetical protein